MSPVRTIKCYVEVIGTALRLFAAMELPACHRRRSNPFEDDDDRCVPDAVRTMHQYVARYPDGANAPSFSRYITTHSLMPLPPLSLPPHLIEDPLRLLAQRATLPGAYGYDQSAHALRVAAARGVPHGDRLALALHGSWMVNSRATSPVFRRWLLPPARPAWTLLDATLSDGPDGWLALSADDRAATSQAVALLCATDVGAAALSKVLALLYPQTMCLMDDHAIAFLGLAYDVPAGDEKGTAGPTFFAPTLDAFAAAVVAHRDALTALAAAHTDAVLDATQALDRIVWVASYGERFFRTSPAARP